MLAVINFDAIFERSPNAYMLLDRELRYVAANAAYLEVTNSTTSDLLGRRVLDVFPNEPNDPSNTSARLLRESLEKVFRTGRADVLALIPYKVPRAGEALETAEYRYWSATHTPIPDESGAIAFVLQHAVDVTAQTRLEVELAGRVERERFLAQSIPQQIWTSLPDGKLDFVNREVTEYFSTTEADVLGAGWQSKIHPDDITECLSRWRRSLDTGEDYEVEFRLRRADGSWRWHLGRARAFRHGDGAIVKWFGTNTDMDELTRARDELRARSEMDRHLIGIVSHDLRNPLNAIGIGASLLKRGPLDPQQHRIVDRMMASFERAGRLIRDFLDFTQARVSGSIPVRPTGANLREITEQVCEEVQPMYPDHRYRLECTGRQTGQWDPDRMAQLIGNLVSNAFQHSPPGGLVSVMSAGGDTRHVLSVHNGGAPIPDADRERLFRPFERGRNAGGSKDRSIGLGLYISESIVQAHGGTIEAASSRDDGTTFTVTLPYATMGGSSNHP